MILSHLCKERSVEFQHELWDVFIVMTILYVLIIEGILVHLTMYKVSFMPSSHDYGKLMCLHGSHIDLKQPTELKEGKYFWGANPSNAVTTFVQCTRMERVFEKHLNPAMLVFIR